MTPNADNAARFRTGTDHVESWFVRANDPVSPKAIWLKATVLTRADGTSLSQAWCSVFDGDRTQAFCLDVPLDEATFDDSPSGLLAKVGSLKLDLNSEGGSSTGSLVSGSSRVGWDLGFDRLQGSLGRPLTLFPSQRLIDAPFPKNKLLTPFPVAMFGGSVTWDEATWDLDGWVGMQGHNWGAAHSPEYAWGQCVFPDLASGAPYAVVEGASGRIELGSRLSPLMSMLVVRRGDEEYRFDKIVDLWRQRPEVEFPRWSLRMSGRDGDARLEMLGAPESMVCLAYKNPARATSYCLNSKTASVRLTVKPKRGEQFELISEHGGALEFLGPEQVLEVQPVV
ncbi:MAG TPA: hypothetical protein VFT00_00630 [Nocardioides sp.]|nr:hypothetical protein [Nocardioides sp.]